MSGKTQTRLDTIAQVMFILDKRIKEIDERLAKLENHEQTDNASKDNGTGKPNSEANKA